MRNQNAEIASRFEELITHQVNDKGLPSISYAIVNRGGILASGHIATEGRHVVPDDASVFRIGSLSKMFTTLGLMQLAEKELVDIDADITTYIPHFKPYNPFANAPSGTLGSEITLRKLMSHTAGIVREPKSGHYLDAHRPSLTETVDELAVSTLKEDPSKGVMRYSNAGIAVVGSVIERVSGLSYPDYIAENILAPLGMTDTAVTLTPEIERKLAPAFMWTVDGDVPAPVFDLGGSPAGNIYSTVPDMARFASALINGGFAADGRRMVRPDTLLRMWEPVGERPPGYEGPQKGYGLGFGVGRMDGWLSVGHSGAVYGYATHMSVLPHAGLACLIFSTLDFTNQIAGRLANLGLQVALAARKMGEMPSRPEPVKTATPTEMQNLSGHYVRADGKETVEIRPGNARLYLMGDGLPLEIRPVTQTEFIVDGRLHSDGTDYQHRQVMFPGEGQMTWKGADWQKTAPDMTAPPEALAPHLGAYGPEFNITTLSYENGRLICLIEYFCTHDCEPLGGNLYRMHGSLYEDETLELGARDENGIAGIRVGPMFLARRP